MRPSKLMENIWGRVRKNLKFLCLFRAECIRIEMVTKMMLGEPITDGGCNVKCTRYSW